MPQFLSGPGIGLPFPQNLYPTQLNNAPQDASSNTFSLNQGDVFVLPAGDWYVTLGLYCIIQYLDPVTGIWATGPGAAFNRGQIHVSSDGFNCRVANLTGCVISASVINGGTSYVQATTTITVVGAFQTGVALPTFAPIVGGALGFTGTFATDIPTKGAGYGIPPVVMIPPPPPAVANPNGVGGIPATAVAILGASGSLTSVSITNPGAGYPSAPVAAILTSPFDPNLSTGITQASVAFSLTSAGVIMGAFCTNNGGPLNNGSLNSLTLTIGGAGTSGSLTANVMQTVVSATVSGPGTGYGTSQGLVTTVGGVPNTGTITNDPMASYLAWDPRPANIGLTPGNTSVSVATAGTVYDGGLFEGAPGAIWVPGGGVVNSTVTLGTIALQMGGRHDRVVIQAAP
jgi:hypothetical protein